MRVRVSEVVEWAGEIASLTSCTYSHSHPDPPTHDPVRLIRLQYVVVHPVSLKYCQIDCSQSKESNGV
jgi:hypothetical protein